MTESVEMGEFPSGGNAIIGNSRLMQNIYKEIGRIANKPVTVLIRGETGTGKELVAPTVLSTAAGTTGERFRGGKLRSHSGDAAGKRTLRARTRGLHRRGSPAH